MKLIVQYIIFVNWNLFDLVHLSKTQTRQQCHARSSLILDWGIVVLSAKC